MDHKLAQKGCDRDSSRDANPEMAHLLDPYELGYFGVASRHSFFGPFWGSSRICHLETSLTHEESINGNVIR